MKRVQIIEHNGKPAFAVVPIELWERVRENIEEADDVAAYDRAVAKDDGFTIPAAVMRAELGGSHPLRAWREHRSSTLQALADAAGVSKLSITQALNCKGQTGYVSRPCSVAHVIQARSSLVTSSSVALAPILSGNRIRLSQGQRAQGAISPSQPRNSTAAPISCVRGRLIPR